VALFSFTVFVVCFLSPVIERLALMACISTLFSGLCGPWSGPADQLSWLLFFVVPVTAAHNQGTTGSRHSSSKPGYHRFPSQHLTTRPPPVPVTAPHNQATTGSFLTSPDPLRTLLITSYHSALSFEIYWHSCWMSYKIKRSSFTSNRPAGSGFQLRHQFENVITSSRFRLEANETMFNSK
jgi:hypothetical protein